MKLSRLGLARRGRLDPFGCDETRFLDPLDDILREGRTLAEVLRARFDGEWQGSVDPAFRAYAL
jgi:glutamate--cysteine ligase